MDFLSLLPRPVVIIQVELRKGLPFDIAITNETKSQTFNDTDAGRNLIDCEDADDMFKKLGI